MSDWKKILFLDIDGVLNNDGFYTRTRGKAGNFDPENVKCLNQLSDLGVEVVISSSWGYDAGRTEKTLREVGVVLPIVGYTDHFHSDWFCRGNEIEKWLCDNFGSFGTKFGSKYYQKDYEYVIFDDDADMLMGQKDNFVQTDRYKGLTQEDIDKAISILERKSPE